MLLEFEIATVVPLRSKISFVAGLLRHAAGVKVKKPKRIGRMISDWAGMMLIDGHI